MRIDLRAHGCALTIALAFGLTGCGPQLGGGGTFEKSNDDCSTSVASHRYLVTMNDGRVAVVRANSDDEFQSGYLKENSSRVKYAEPDYWVRTDDGDPGWISRKPTRAADNWGVTKIGADTMWAAGWRGQGVSIAVIDTGVDITHPQLVNQLMVNEGEVGQDSVGRELASNGVDDDHNGLIDDAYGYDFIRSRPLGGEISHHGTHVAGIIAAEHRDVTAGPKPYVQGVAPAAKILPLAFLDKKGLGLMSDAVRALNYAVARGVRVVNASWGGSQCSRSLRETIRSLSRKDIAFVTAAGNESINVDHIGEFPATLNLPPMITIGATDPMDGMALFSNFGLRSTHLFAPGHDIISLLPKNQMGSLSGTSMATPFAAGAVALLLSAEPSATVAQLREALYTSSTQRPEYLNASHGRLDLRSALAHLRRIMAEPITKIIP